MKVVLTKKVLNLGEAGDIVEVTAGYARNMLIPKGWAKMATSTVENLANQAKEKQANTEKKVLDNAKAKAEKAKAHQAAPQQPEPQKPRKQIRQK